LKNLLKLESKGSVIIAMTRYKNVKAEFLFTNTCWRKKGKKKNSKGNKSNSIDFARHTENSKKKVDFSP